MFCQQCKSEYRQGFDRYTDCGVELAEKPAQDEGDLANTGPSGNLAPLWEGENLALHTTLLEYLESAGIRYFDRRMGVFRRCAVPRPFPVTTDEAIWIVGSFLDDALRENDIDNKN
jgi:hypothetical protein